MAIDHVSMSSIVVSAYDVQCYWGVRGVYVEYIHESRIELPPIGNFTMTSSYLLSDFTPHCSSLYIYSYYT